MNNRESSEERRIKLISRKLNIPSDIVSGCIDLAYGFMAEKIEEPTNRDGEILSSLDFEKLYPIIKVPKLGFFVPSYAKYLNINKNKLKKLNKK